MLHRLKNILLYMGLEKDEYMSVRDDITLSNRNSVTIYSVIVIIGFAAILLVSLLGIGNFTVKIYAGGLAIMLVIFGLNYLVGKKYAPMVIFCSYFFIMALLSVGIYIAVVLSPNSAVASYLAFLMGMPALFCINPIGYGLITSIMGGILIVMLRGVQVGDTLVSNEENIIIYTIASFVIAAYLMYVKASRLWSEQLNTYLLEKDQMTGIYNRRSYEKMLNELRKARSRTAVVAFDVNGLKRTNDTLGHAAGDELICGAASCIDKVFSKYGSCFRTGGDEFMAILSNLTENIDEITAEFDAEVASWSGKQVKSLSVSYGVVTEDNSPEMNMDDMVNEADRLMYTAKANYYRASGIDRRRR